ncbi:ANGL7 protein, partial [Amia calva]|nr:ANGL7 protein [Amia calva]
MLRLVMLGVMLVLALPGETGAQAMKKQQRRMTPPRPNPKQGCCDEVKLLKVKVANLTSMLAELTKKQETDWLNMMVQMMELENSNRQHEGRIVGAEGKYSEINNRLDIMQLQAAQSVTQTSAVFVICISENTTKNFFGRSLTLPVGVPLCLSFFLSLSLPQVYCDMESNGGGWTVIQRRKVGLTSFNRDWKQYKDGFGNIRGDFWLGNANIFRLTRQPSILRIELEDWEGATRYAEYSHFSLSNEVNSYKLFIANYSGNAGQDSLRYHNNTNFSTKDKDNDKCVDNCADRRKGGYWYNCCTDSNLNGVFYRYGEHTKNSDGITWYGWHGSNYSLKRVEMKIRPQNFQS